MTGLGRFLFGVGVVALGALGVGLRDFAFAAGLVPPTIPWHDALTLVCGAALMVGGLGLFVPRVARLAALVLAGVLLVFALLARVPPLAAGPGVEGNWYGLSETLTLVAGAWTIFALLPTRAAALGHPGAARLGQILFAVALPAIGLSHFVYLDQTAPIIPAWLPFHVPLAYATGAAHIAAGIGILFAVLPRLAAILEAIMVSLFTLLVWVPMATTTPTSAANWTELFLSMAISGAAWAVAESFRVRRIV